LAQRRGDTRVISPVANKLAAEQAQTLRRCGVRRVILCLDPDGGGRAGTPSCINTLAGVGITAYVAPWLPDGLDPDAFIQREGIDVWRKHLEGADHAYRYLAGVLLTKHRRGEGWSDLGRDAALEEAVTFAGAQPPERDDELSRHFWPEVLKSTGARLKDLLPRVCAARRSHKDHTRDHRHEANGHAGGPEASGPSSPGSPASPCSAYVVEAGRICRRGFTRGGDEYTEPLCNFTARIAREEVLDDGSGEERHTFTIAGALSDGTTLPPVTVPSADFAGMAWPLKEWG